MVLEFPLDGTHAFLTGVMPTVRVAASIVRAHARKLRGIDFKTPFRILTSST